MALHRYDIGTLVYMQYNEGSLLPKSRAYTVEAQMPPVGTSFQYRIKSEDEAFRRVVPEHQVSAVADTTAFATPAVSMHSGERD